MTLAQLPLLGDLEGVGALQVILFCFILMFGFILYQIPKELKSQGIRSEKAMNRFAKAQNTNSVVLLELMMQFNVHHLQATGTNPSIGETLDERSQAAHQLFNQVQNGLEKIRDSIKEQSEHITP